MFSVLPPSRLSRRVPPARLDVQVEVLLKIGQMLQRLAQLRPSPREPLLPHLPVNRPDDEVPVLGDTWGKAGGAVCQFRLQLVSVGDDQLAGRAVAAGLAQDQRPEALDVDEEGELARVSEAAAARAL